MKVLAHIRREDRKSWASHASKGFHVCSAMNYYRCFNIWTQQTGRTRICDTIKWLPHNFRLPIANQEGLLIAAADDLTTALLKAEDKALLPPLSTDATQQLTQLHDIFQASLDKPTPPKARTPTSSPADTSLTCTLQPASTNIEAGQRVQIRDSSREPRVPNPSTPNASPTSLTDKQTIPPAHSRHIECTLIMDTHREPRVLPTKEPTISPQKQVRWQLPLHVPLPARPIPQLPAPSPIPTIPPQTNSPLPGPQLSTPPDPALLLDLLHNSVLKLPQEAYPVPHDRYHWNQLSTSTLSEIP